MNESLDVATLGEGGKFATPSSPATRSGWQIGRGPAGAQCKRTVACLNGRNRRWDRAGAAAVAALDKPETKWPVATLWKIPCNNDRFSIPRNLWAHASSGFRLQSRGRCACECYQTVKDHYDRLLG